MHTPRLRETNDCGYHFATKKLFGVFMAYEWQNRAKAAHGIVRLATVSIEEVGERIKTPKMFQLYIHKDKGLNASMIERCKAAKFDAIALTVDTIVSGNRERCLRSGFTSPPRFTPASVLSYAIHPSWALNYMFREKFSLPNLQTHVDAGTNVAVSVAEYFNTMLDTSMDWKTAEKVRADWGGEFCLKGIMSIEDARRAADIGCSGIVLSNHGGRQLDGSRSAFDQLDAVIQAVGDRLDVMIDGGIQRGTHVLKALSLGAKAVGLGRAYLFPLAVAGQRGVDRAMDLLAAEITRDMKLMGAKSISDLGRANVVAR